jgi:hypothetical protein
MKFAPKLSLLGAACAALLAAADGASAAMMPPPAPGLRVAAASMIVVGKVESIEEKPVSAKPFPTSTEKAEYQVAVIKISDPILNAKGLTTVRVGFLPPPMGQIRRRPTVNFAKDQEVIVFLTPHGEGNFMIAQGYYDVINKQGNQNFDKEVETAKKYVKMLANPKESLKAEKPEARLEAAALFVSAYRTKRFNGVEPKTEAVDAEVSKLILTALAEADWKKQVIDMRTNPQVMFSELGVTEKDGFKPPMIEVQGKPQIDYQKLPEYAKQWCKDNAGKYKIERFVYEDKKEEKKDK